MATTIKKVIFEMLQFASAIFIAAVFALLSPAGAGAEQLTVLHEVAENVGLSMCLNGPQIQGILDRNFGATRQTVSFDNITPAMLSPGQWDYRLQGQGIILQGISGSAQIGGSSDSGGVCGGHIGTGWYETRIRVHFVTPGTNTPATVTHVGGFTTTEDAGNNCMEFFDASGTSLGSGCVQHSPWTPTSTIEFLGGSFAPGIGYIDVYSHKIPYELDLLTFTYGGEVDDAPIAVAGIDQTVNEGDAVVLDGSGSSDPEGNSLTYEWSQIAGNAVSLNLTDPAHPTFTAPIVPSGGSVLTFELVVNDGNLKSFSDIVNILIKNINHAPIADAGGDQTVAEGATTQLDGSGSYDPDCESLVYEWSQTAGPAVQLSDPAVVNSSFIAPLVGSAGAVITFDLRVNDGIDSSVDTIDIFVENVNHAPIAGAGFDQIKNEGSVVMLDGTASSDPDMDAISFSWSQASGPAVVLSDPYSSNPTFTAPLVGQGGETLSFQLVVNDGTMDSMPDQVSVALLNVNDPPVCESARAVPASLWPPNHQMSSVTIIGVTDPNNQNVDIRITAVTQDEPVNNLGDGNESPDAVIQGEDVLLRAERSGIGNGRVYWVYFTADDGQGGACSGRIAVSVPHKRNQGDVSDDGQIYDSTQQ